MKLTKIFSVIVITGMAVMLMSTVQGPSSSGAPASHTGAPGEESCATSGCHDDNAMNAGTAKLSLDLEGSSSYVPGKTYTLKVRISDPEIKRFGFQIVALKEADNTKAGKFRITDPERTQLVYNNTILTDREYVTYAFRGTDAVSPGAGEWTMTWKAPVSNTGNVRFYLSGISANDNENDKGDFVYTSNFIFTEKK